MLQFSLSCTVNLLDDSVIYCTVGIHMFSAISYIICTRQLFFITLNKLYFRQLYRLYPLTLLNYLSRVTCRETHSTTTRWRWQPALQHRWCWSSVRWELTTPRLITLSREMSYHQNLLSQSKNLHYCCTCYIQAVTVGKRRDSYVN